MSMRGNSEETMTIDTLIGDTNFYNAKVEQDATTKEWRVVEGEPTELKVEWEANRYKLILDLNDGSAGNSDTYKGSNFVSTTSITGSGLYYEGNNLKLNVIYGTAINQNDDYSDLPEPTRPGYTFGGWYALKNTTLASKKIESSTTFDWHEVSYNHDTDAYQGAGDTKIYARWIKNKYTIKFLKMAEGTQMDEPQGTIADINTEFDTATPFTIPRIKKADGTFALKVDGFMMEIQLRLILKMLLLI